MRDFRKFCRPKAVKYPKIGDILIKLKCGETVTVGAGEFKKINKFFKKNGVYGGISDLSEGDIRVFNSDLNEDMYIPANQLANLGDSWDVIGLYGITTYDENTAPDGSYVIMSNGNLLIISPEDYSKVSSNWQHVDDIVETRVVTKFNVTSTSNSTKILYSTTNISLIEIDGVKQPSVTDSYTFSTTGEHTIKYTLADPTIITDHTFQACINMVNCIIPDSVITIDEGAFNACSSMTTCKLSNNLTSVGSNAFNSCSALMSIDIPSSLRVISGGAFAYCNSITSIVIPDTVQTLMNGSFYPVLAATSITLGNVANYSYGAIGPFNVTTELNFNISSIPSDSNWLTINSLTTLKFGPNVTDIPQYAFPGCANITSITVEATTPPTLGNGAFYSIPSNCQFYVPSGSVDTYKAASGWSDYANRIQAIPA